MASITELNEQGLALTRSTATDILVASFQDTETLLDQPETNLDQREYLWTARGWIIKVLEERGLLALIGLDDEYEA